jgi:predicted O-methyltransferase YrrM
MLPPRSLLVICAAGDEFRVRKPEGENFWHGKIAHRLFLAHSAKTAEHRGRMERPCAKLLTSEMTQPELDGLRDALSTRQRPGQHLEIGTAAGGTLCEMMRAATHRPRFVVIDTMTYFANQRETVEKNLLSHGLPLDQVEFRVMRSWDAFQDAIRAREAFDFILIDGTHKFRYVMQDLHWAGLLNPNGILALHDYTPRLRSVKWAADYFLANNRNYHRVALAGSLLILEKTAPDGPRGPNLLPDPVASLMHPLFQFENSVRKRLGMETSA